MKIVSAELVTSASTGGPREGLLRDDVAQFAFAGRSNVGKSSLLNALTKQKIARTSAAAGKTRQANIFRITADGGPGGPGSWSVYLVDLPGYGYARGGDQAARELGDVVDAYVAAAARRSIDQRQATRRTERAGTVFLLVDSRHPGLPLDLQAHHWLSDAIGPLRVVATKVDKLSQSERARNLRELERRFGEPPIPVSVSTGEGLDALWRVISTAARGFDDRGR